MAMQQLSPSSSLASSNGSSGDLPDLADDLLMQSNDSLFELKRLLHEMNRHNELIDVLHVHVLLPLCLLGCATNCVAIGYVTCNAAGSLRRSGAIRIFLLCLCAFDCAQLVFTCHLAVPSVCQRLSAPDLPTPYLCAVYYRVWRKPLAHLSACVDTAHMWLLVALTAHRHYKISHPLHAHVHDSEAYAKLCILVITLLALLFRVPIAFEYEFVNRNGTLVVLDTPLKHNYVYHMVYHLLLTTLLFNLIPFLTLTLLNATILRTLWLARSTVRKDSSNRSRRREQRAAIAICTIVSLFLAFHSLFMFELLMKLYYSLSSSASPASWLQLVSVVSTVLACVSAALNPLIYVAMGTGCTLVCCAANCCCCCCCCCPNLFTYHNQNSHSRQQHKQDDCVMQSGQAARRVVKAQTDAMRLLQQHNADTDEQIAQQQPLMTTSLTAAVRRPAHTTTGTGDGVDSSSVGRKHQLIVSFLRSPQQPQQPERLGLLSPVPIVPSDRSNSSDKVVLHVQHDDEQARASSR